MDIKVHRPHQIGGCVTEIRSDRTRVFVDIGENLPALDEKGARGLEIEGLTTGSPDCSGLFISHYHGDHVGMVGKVLPGIPIFMGKDAHRIYLNLNEHLHSGCPEKIRTFCTFNAAEKIQISDDFFVTPYCTDHSAYDAYMFLIEAEGKRILHTGDFRAHGWKMKGVFRVLESYIKNVDVLIIEGTMLSRTGENVMREVDLFNSAKILMRENRNTFILCSSTNIDSIASFYKAAQETGRLFVCDSYQRSVLDIVSETAQSSIYSFPMAKIYWGGREDCVEKMKQLGFCMLVRANGRFEKIMNLFPDSLFVYSMWEGYLKGDTLDEKIYSFIPKGENGKLKYKGLHTSGHATRETIIEVCRKLRPGIIIPIHSEKPDAFYDLDLQNSEIKILSNEDIFIF